MSAISRRARLQNMNDAAGFGRSRCWRTSAAVRATAASNVVPRHSSGERKRRSSRLRSRSTRFTATASASPARNHSSRSFCERPPWESTSPAMPS